MRTAEAPSLSLPLRTEEIPLVPPMDPALPRNAFTVDVEDWYQSCIDYDAPISERVVKNVDRILAMLDECGVKGSFFVQGRVAETFPNLVASLVDEGHEVQAHGYSHRSLSAMSRAELRDELERAKKTVEDAAGTPVTAFRAQDFSISASNLWAFEILADVGFEIDSSIFPMRARHYGIAGWPPEPHYVVADGGVRILEVPVAIWSLGGIRVPVAGGGYFRVLPRRLIGSGLRSIAAAGRPAIVYCHPYEFNPDELAEYRGVPRRFRWSRRGWPSVVPPARALAPPEFAFGRFTGRARSLGNRPNIGHLTTNVWKAATARRSVVAVLIATALLVGGTCGATAPTTTSKRYPVRGVFDRDSSRTGFDHEAALGFNFIDTGPYQRRRPACGPRPEGVHLAGRLLQQQMRVQRERRLDPLAVRAIARVAEVVGPGIRGRPRVGGYFIDDEPDATACPSAPAQMRARSARQVDRPSAPDLHSHERGRRS